MSIPGFSSNDSFFNIFGQQYLRRTLEMAPFPIMLHAEDGEVLHINAIWTELTGYTRQDIPTTQAWVQRAYGEDAARVLENIIAKKYALKSRWEEGEFTITTSYGGQRIWQFSSAPLGQLPDGRRVVISMAADITQLREAEISRWESEERYRSVYEQAAVGLANTTLEGKLLDVNPRFCEMLGYSRKELLGKTVLEITHPDDVGKMLPAVRRLFAGEIPYFFQEKRYLRQDGSYFWSSTGVSLVRNAAGKPKHTLAVICEIGDRKQAEKALQESEARWQFALEGAGDGVWDWNLQTNTVFYSRQWKAILGYDEHELGNSLEEWFERIYLEDRARCHGDLNEHFRGETLTYQNEHRLRCQDGSYKWILARGQVIEWAADGQPLRMIGTHSDISERKQKEATLREKEQRFRNLATNIPGAILRYVLHPDGGDGLLYISPGCYTLWEVEAKTALENVQILWEMVYAGDRAAMYESVLASARTLEPWFWQWRITTPSGKMKWLEAAGRPERQENGDVVWDTVIIDVSESKRAEAAWHKSEERLRLVTENMSDLVCLHYPDGRYLYLTPSSQALLGYTPEELIGRDPYDLLHPAERERIRQEVRWLVDRGLSRPITYRIRQKTGKYIWLETLTQVIWDEEGQVKHWQTTSREVSARIQAEEQLKHEALHDGLTGLPNRSLLMERLNLSLKRAKRHPEFQFALLFLDLDNFKVINDSLGHSIGDELLVAVARQLTKLIRETDVAARLGGDEFVILLEDLDEVEEAVQVAERILSVLQSPLQINEREVFTSTSIGIVAGTTKYHRGEDILRDADLAMYRAKHSGRGRYAIFDPAMHLQVVRRLNLENALRKALENKEFILYYQPVVNLETQIIGGFEALIRWHHPQRGLISPREFIPIAEETGLIEPIGRWVLHTACHQLATWQAQFPHQPLKISINLSVKQLQEMLLRQLEEVLTSSGLQGESLVLEITESMLVENVESTRTLLEQIEARGIRLSIDDFGTGYSSLSYLHQLPVSNLKIDRAFVSLTGPDARNQVIAESIIALSNLLELKAIAEGIETIEQLEWLKELGCELGQGFFFSPPVPAAQVTELLQGKFRYLA